MLGIKSRSKKSKFDTTQLKIQKDIKILLKWKVYVKIINNKLSVKIYD